MKYFHFIIVVLLIVGTSSGQTFVKRLVQPGKILTINDVTSGVQWAKRVRQGFSMKVWLSNQMSLGMEAWNPNNVPIDECASGLGLSYPYGTCVEHLFGAGPAIGGIIDGVPRVSLAYHPGDGSHEFLPVREDTARDKIWKTNLGDETFHQNNDGWSGYYYYHNVRVNRAGFDDDADGKIDEDELDGLDNDGDWNPLVDDLGRDGLPDSLEVSCDAKPYDAVTNPDPAYDNYDPAASDSCHTNGPGSYLLKNDKGRYTQNNGIPDHGEPHVDEDYAARSDNDLYFTATDTFHQPVLPSHFPMGIKIFAKSYAWMPGFAEGILPFDYLFINVGGHVIHDVYLGFFADMDVGPINVSSYGAHNYSCYLPFQRTAFSDNAQDLGSTPLGVTMLGASRPLDSLRFIWQWFDYLNPGTTDTSIYSWMSGAHWGYDASQYIRSCQTPSSPTDTRFFFSVGPFATMNPGDTLKIAVALVSGQSVAAGPNNLVDNATRALAIYDSMVVLGVKEISSAIPNDFSLSQNYPNPFNPTTQVGFQNSKTGYVSLKVYDVLGREVATLVNENLQPGTYTIQWNASEMPSGVYFYHLQAGDYSNVKKMLLMK